ncbi:hypothetical protein T484DRAFT_1862266 [Baffinella frigidus]|nr:hypothetical protein T484DRAFT_1862266 [Cryptophyta sp. CCMP2293]
MRSRCVAGRASGDLSCSVSRVELKAKRTGGGAGGWVVWSCPPSSTSLPPAEISYGAAGAGRKGTSALVAMMDVAWIDSLFARPVTEKPVAVTPRELQPPRVPPVPRRPGTGHHVTERLMKFRVRVRAGPGADKTCAVPPGADETCAVPRPKPRERQAGRGVWTVHVWTMHLSKSDTEKRGQNTWFYFNAKNREKSWTAPSVEGWVIQSGPGDNTEYPGLKAFYFNPRTSAISRAPPSPEPPLRGA